MTTTPSRYMEKRATAPNTNLPIIFVKQTSQPNSELVWGTVSAAKAPLCKNHR
jgi:hypothetical protein